jgi:hypothetical protein
MFCVLGIRPVASRISLPSRIDVPSDVVRLTRTEFPEEPFHARDPRIQANIGAVEMEELENRIGNVLVLSRKQLRAALQNGDAAAETDERLREFQADITAAQDDQMARHAIEFECLDVCERFGGAKTGDLGDSRVSAQIQEHPVALQSAHAAVAQSNLDGFRPDEAALAKHQLGATFLVFLHVHADEALYHLSLASPHFSHFKRCRRSTAAEITVMTDKVGHLRAVNDVFRRQAVSFPPVPLPKIRTSKCSISLMARDLFLLFWI